MANLTFVISSNGFGHAKRVSSVLRILVKYSEKLNIVIVCNDCKKKLIQNDKVLNNLSFCTQIMKHEIDYLNQNEVDLSQYLKWKYDFENSDVVKNSDLIVSDNLVIPLFSNTKVILMGSFLWYDIIESKNNTLNKIANLEKKILKIKRPKIICLKSMYMSSIEKYTHPIKIPWFTHRNKAKLTTTIHKEVLITGGGTGQLDECLIKIAKSIANCSTFKIYLDERLINLYKINNQYNVHNFLKFDFRATSFNRLNVIICRPGIGILTDCIKYSKPAIAVYDNNNKEIIHNAKQIKKQKLGIAIQIKDGVVSNYAIHRIIKLINNRSDLNMYIKEIFQQEINGAKKASDIILKEVNL